MANNVATGNKFDLKYSVDLTPPVVFLGSRSDFGGLRIDGLSRNIKNREHASRRNTCGSVGGMMGPILIGHCSSSL